MNTAPVRTRLAQLEAKCDVLLFGMYRGADGRFYNEQGQEVSGSGVGSAVAGTAAAGAIGAAGVASARAVNNRIGGLRATVDGFAGRSRLGQIGGAIGSLAGDAGAAVQRTAVGATDRAAASYGAARKAGYSGGQAALAGLKRAGRSLRKAVRFDAREQVTQLAARIR